MTTVNAILEEDDVSGDVLELDIWHEILRVSRWILKLKNLDDKWGGDIHTNDDAELKINTVSMLKGYVDDVRPYLKDRVVYINLMEVTGRDYGRDLARLYETVEYGDIKADDLMEALFDLSGSEITYTSPSTAPPVNIKRKRFYLIDYLRTTSKRINYDAYVDMIRAFHFFAVGAVAEDSGVTLKSVADALDNNILRLFKGEEIGFSIANCVELTAGYLDDHYSDGNEVDYTLGANTFKANETTIKMVGISSIKFWNTVPAKPQITLDFSGMLYTYSALDLSRSTEMSFYIRHNNTTEDVIIRPQLEDSAGKVIEFSRSKGRSVGMANKGWTFKVPANKWHKIKINIGDDVNLVVQEGQDKWYNISGMGFDWSNVTKITIKACSAYHLPPPIEGDLSPTTLYFDALAIPTIEIRAAYTDASSEADYGKSMWHDERLDIKSQIELQAVAQSELAKRKDPLRNIRIIAIGQTNSKYAGQGLTVHAPGHGITAPTKYRVVKLHHIVRKEPIFMNNDFITEYFLVKHDVTGTQVIDPLRFDLADDPRGTMLEILAEKARRTRSADVMNQSEAGDAHPPDTVFEELGFVHKKLPLYDPTGFHDYRTEEGINNWIEAVTIKYPQYVNTSYRVKGVAIQLRRTTDATKGTIQVKAEARFYDGPGWIQLGSIMECETDAWTEYTALGDLSAAFDFPMDVRFSYRVYQEGAGQTDGYLKDCEVREHYSKTRWEDVEA